MANKFVPWIDVTSSSTIGVSTQSQAVFAQDEQRKVGFVAGDPASAIRVNSALRQANVVVAALMQLADELVTLPNLDLNSSVANITAALKASIITPLTTRLTSLEDAFEEISGDAESLGKRITTLENEMDAVQSKNTQQDSSIDGLSSSMSAAESDIDTLQSDMTSAENRLDKLETHYEADLTTSSWSGSAGNYTYAITATTHGRGTRPQVHTYVDGEETYDSPTIDWTTGNVTLRSNAQVAMKVLIY